MHAARPRLTNSHQMGDNTFSSLGFYHTERKRVKEHMQRHGVIHVPSSADDAAAGLMQDESSDYDDQEHPSDLLFGHSVDPGSKSIQTGVAFSMSNGLIQTIKRRFMGMQRFPATIMTDLKRIAGVDIGSYEEAEKISKEYLECRDDRSYTDTIRKLSDNIYSYQRRFMLHAFDGEFNLSMDQMYAFNSAQGGDGSPASSQPPILSLEYVKSLRNAEYFVLIGRGDMCISTDILIDLCRCPAFFTFCSNEVANIMRVLCRYANTNHKDQEPFKAWLGRRFRYTEEEFNKMLAITLTFDQPAMFQSMLMSLRSIFMLSDEADPKGELKEYFNMDFDSWLRHMDDHIYKLNNAEDRGKPYLASLAKVNPQVCRAVQVMGDAVLKDLEEKEQSTRYDQIQNTMCPKYYVLNDEICKHTGGRPSRWTSTMRIWSTEPLSDFPFQRSGPPTTRCSTARSTRPSSLTRCGGASSR